MKPLIALIFFLFFNTHVKGQWVTIPDANFVYYLQQNFPACMNGNLLDTTCSGIVNTTSLNCSQSIGNFYGIQYFISLEYLNCEFNSSPTFPSLPNSLTYLNCSYSGLSSLPPLPSSLTVLYCYSNSLTSLPFLPNSLYELDCSFNNITSLPALPNSLTKLICDMNYLNYLPLLPNSLFTLGCSNNNLMSLPTLPDSLKYFGCVNDNLTSLPTLPGSLINLSCNNNNLTSLPPLPSSLTLLRCFNNNLTSLPALPIGLNDLDCQSNQITCLPNLPHTLSYFSLYSNPITCLPNYVPAMNGTGYLNYPICSENDSISNPNNCLSFKGVSGNTFKDFNGDCTYNNGDTLTKNIAVEIWDSTNTKISTFYSLSNGIYNFTLATGTYTVKIDTANEVYTYNCNYPGIDTTITLTSANPLAKNVNFKIACKPGFDVGVKSINRNGVVFPGLQHQLNISAGDLSQWYNLHCATGVSGNVVVTVNGPVTFDSIPPGAFTPATIAGNSLIYTISDFGALNLNSFAMWFTTDISAQAGDQICVNVNVSPTTGDNDTTNNTYTFCYSVTNSYDPNDKQVYPTSVNPAYNGYFTYTINFQNLGTAPAQNIRVVDTLANNLDLSTFEIINYSHANTSTLTGNVAAFRFPNIQLADSASNPDGSKGFIQYRIKPVANLPFGTQIENKAAIYFDFNSPITTNTAVSTFNSTVGLTANPYLKESGVIVYPNPGKGIFNLRFSDNSSSTKTIEVFNLIGEKVFSATSKTVNSVIDLANETNGVYVLRVSDSTAVYTQRLTKQ